MLHIVGFFGNFIFTTPPKFVIATTYNLLEYRDKHTLCEIVFLLFAEKPNRALLYYSLNIAIYISASCEPICSKINDIYL